MIARLLLLALIMMTAGSLPASAVSPEAERSASQALSKFGTVQGIRDNAANPLLGDSQMQTIDDSASFGAHMLCPSSDRFLEVLVQPAASGDITAVVATIDGNMDGVMDSTFTSPFVVSGVCANGIISCDIGTWSNCHFYRWQADNAYNITLQAAPPADLGGCYCINTSCGSNLVWQNLALVLKDLGGGMAGAIQKVNPQMAIADTVIQGPVIRYLGQNASRCTSAPTGSGANAPQNYFHNFALLTTDTTATVLNQSGDPNSYYNMITRSLPALDNPVAVRSCAVTRMMLPNNQNCLEPAFNFSGGDPGCPATESSCGPGCRELVAGTQLWGGGGSICEDDPLIGITICRAHTDFTFGILSGRQYITRAVAFAGGFDDDGGVNIAFNNNVILTRGGMRQSNNTFCMGSNYCRVNLDLSSLLGTNTMYAEWGGNADNQNRCAYFGTTIRYVPHCPTAGGTCTGVPPTCCTLNEAIDDQCQLYESDSDCRLRDESVDGVVTMDNFNPTGLSPIAFCADVACGSDTRNVCAGWWQKNRSYVCTAQPFNFNDAQRRMRNIRRTTTDNTQSFYYQDLRKDENGNWITEDSNLGLPDRDVYEACETACKTRKQIIDTQASGSYNVSQTRTNTTSYEFYYKTCTNNLCPLGAGEEIVKGCQCINDFAEAASIMQMLRQAGKDIICSDGTQKPM